VIWRELLRIARGITTVQEAGVVIAQAIDEIGDVDEAICHWFMISKSTVNAYLHLVFNCFFEGPPKENSTNAHLCSLEVDVKSVPPNWPLASVMLPALLPDTNKDVPPKEDLPVAERPKRQTNVSPKEDLPVEERPKRQTANYSNTLPSSQVTVAGSRPNKRKSKAQPPAPQAKLTKSMPLDGSTPFEDRRYAPIMVGQTYIKTEDIDLEVLQVFFHFHHTYLSLFYIFSSPGTCYASQIF